MYTFFDMIREAHEGRAAELFLRQFGVSPEETARAVTALMPAFALGFEKTAARPDAMAELTRLMTKTGFGRLNESPQTAFSAQAIALGEEVMGKLFGSPALAKAIADQAAAMSGVAQESVAKIMPVLAASMIDAMAKTAQSAAQSAAASAPPAPPKAGAQRAKAQSAPENPWEAMFATMMGAPEKPEPEPAPEPEPQDPARAAADDAFAAYAKLIDAGREMQDAQMKMMKAMMDGFFGRKG